MHYPKEIGKFLIKFLLNLLFINFACIRKLNDMWKRKASLSHCPSDGFSIIMGLIHLLITFHLPVLSRCFPCYRRDAGTETLEAPSSGEPFSDGHSSPVTKLEYTWKHVNIEQVGITITSCYISN